MIKIYQQFIFTALCIFWYPDQASCHVHRRNVISDPCLGQCKDTHVNDMHNLLGPEAAESSTEFLRPLHTILLRSFSDIEVAGKLETACKYNKAHHQCLAACPETLASRAMIIGLRPWSFICKNWRFGDLRQFIPCLQEKAKILDDQCAMQLENLKSVFNSIWHSNRSIADLLGPMCRASKSYDLCYGDAVGFHCGQSATAFWQELGNVNNATVLELLMLTDRFTIPDQCRNRWYESALPPLMTSRPEYTKNGTSSAYAQRQVASRSSGADLTVERFWGKSSGAESFKLENRMTHLLAIILAVIIA